MGFYSDMAAMAYDLLAPDSNGGLGQGHVVLVRTTPGTPDPDAPWEPVTPTTTSETLRAAVSGADARLVGTEVGGAVILASDRTVVCAVPVMGYQAGDTLMIDGKPVLILSVQKIPAAGTTSAVRFIVRVG